MFIAGWMDHSFKSLLACFQTFQVGIRAQAEAVTFFLAMTCSFHEDGIL